MSLFHFALSPSLSFILRDIKPIQPLSVSLAVWNITLVSQIFLPAVWNEPHRQTILSLADGNIAAFCNRPVSLGSRSFHSFQMRPKARRWLMSDILKSETVGEHFSLPRVICRKKRAFFICLPVLLLCYLPTQLQPGHALSNLQYVDSHWFVCSNTNLHHVCVRS